MKPSSHSRFALNKRFGFFAVLFFSVISLYGAYLTNVPQTVRQPDGTILRCLASGDEFYNWLHDLAGYTIMQHPDTGFYVYAIKTANGDLAASSLHSGTGRSNAPGIGEMGQEIAPNAQSSTGRV